SKTVLGNVEDGVAETKKLIADYNAIAEKMATDYSDALLEEMGRLQEQMDHKDAWDLDSLLEQPTNHLDAESVQWLEQHLEKYPGTVVAVTHDRYFLDDVAQWILELDR